MKKKVSIIIPVYNEEHSLPLLFTKLDELYEKLHSSYTVQIVFVNDGSVDRSWNIIELYAQEHKHVQGINFSRNFGHQMALTAGYDYVDADCVVTMDADMQDPPELIFDMLTKWQQGVQIVYARRIDRGDTWLKRVTAQWYYWALGVIADVSIPRNVGDFRLIDKKVVDVLKRSRERSRYLRGMVAWTGFTHAFVDFKRPDRVAGTSGYTWKKMLQLAFDGVTSFSLFPLKVAAFAGCFVILTGCLMFAYITLDALIYRVHYPLFKWLVTIIYIFMGVQFMLLWLIGEYIGRMYEYNKGRPLYIIAQIAQHTSASKPQTVSVYKISEDLQFEK